MIVQEMDYIEHYGTPRHSGRYPWGSGENPYQSAVGARSKLHYIDELKSQGLSDTEIAKVCGIKTGELRAIRTAGREQQRAADAAQAIRLKEKGYSNVKIGEIMDRPESSVRNLLKYHEKTKEDSTKNVSNYLKDQISEKTYLDVGKGVETNMGISKTKLDAALTVLKTEGYKVYNIKVDQLGTDYQTTLKVLCPPGTEWKDVMQHKDQIGLPFGAQFEDNGLTMRNIKEPVSVDPKRVQIRYAEEGGIEMDGVIQLRRGAEDLNLGKARYAQVRIKVGDDMYLKGMAMYADDLPPGVDIRFNTNKDRAHAPEMSDVLKSLKKNPDGSINEDNPFGATIRQYEYTDKSGKKHQSPINIVNEEGDWSKWNKTLSSQFLGKQSLELVTKQLNATYADKEKEFEEICALTNPAVKKKILESFADDCDAGAVHLKAKGMPGQASKVILPFPDMKENEIYAPGYNNGDHVVLVRYPHAGIFEIPQLTVNNKHPTANKTIKNAIDAVGINSKVAEQLSGADFDGDTVLVIPNNSGAIKTSKPLAQLQGFDPKVMYRAYEGMPKVGPDTGFHKQKEMGEVSNLITDMTLKGAKEDEIARAVKHSMVVIDAEKHNLNWKQSAIDNNIAALKEEYQGRKDAGAATLLSRAKSDYRMPQVAQRMGITPQNTNPLTGEKIDKFTGATYVDKDGKVRERLTKTTKMAATSDARTLLSEGATPREAAYADYANKMKALANKARKEYLDTPNLKYSPEAKTKYAAEVSSLNAKLNAAKKNAPLERAAQVYANVYFAACKREHPDMDKDEQKKIKGQALTAARNRIGAGKSRIEFTDKEWEAIQAGAISHSKLMDMLSNANMDSVRAHATPHETGGLTAAQIARAKSMLRNSKASTFEVADALGVSVTTLYNVIGITD